MIKSSVDSASDTGDALDQLIVAHTKVTINTLRIECNESIVCIAQLSSITENTIEQNERSKKETVSKMIGKLQRHRRIKSKG